VIIRRGLALTVMTVKSEEGSVHLGLNFENARIVDDQESSAMHPKRLE
jgi:hypothetical protein